MQSGCWSPQRDLHFATARMWQQRQPSIALKGRMSVFMFRVHFEIENGVGIARRGQRFGQKVNFKWQACARSCKRLRS